MAAISADQLITFLRSPGLGLVTHQRPETSVEITWGDGGAKGLGDGGGPPTYPVNVWFGYDATIVFNGDDIARADISYPPDAQNLYSDDVHTFLRRYVRIISTADVVKIVITFLESLNLMSELRFEEKFSSETRPDRLDRVAAYCFGIDAETLALQQIAMTARAVSLGVDDIHYADANGTFRSGFAELISDLRKGVLSGVLLTDLNGIGGAGREAETRWRALADAAGDLLITLDVISLPGFPSPFVDIEKFLIAVREMPPAE